MTDLRDELRELGHGITVEARDDMADLVLATISVPRRRTRKWRRWVAALAALLAAVGVSAAVSAPVRGAITHVFGFGGTEVRREPGPPPASNPALPGTHAADLAAAEREVGFAVRVPRALGEPASVTVSDGRVVSLGYTLPSGPVQIDEFPGNLGVMWEKYIAGGLAQRVEVNGHDAVWFDKPITLVYVLP
ncbi:MAG TPA: hypothetical protein VHT50_29100, partial [Mycobacterium sp.]|nr:hypothetical protein [Mycobacterium sp.]